MELFTPEDTKFLRSGLDLAAKGGEITKSAIHFSEGLRNRGVTSYDLEKAVENSGGSASILSKADWGLSKMIWPRHPYHGKQFRARAIAMAQTIRRKYMTKLETKEIRINPMEENPIHVECINTTSALLTKHWAEIQNALDADDELTVNVSYNLDLSGVSPVVKTKLSFYTGRIRDERETKVDTIQLNLGFK